MLIFFEVLIMTRKELEERLAAVTNQLLDLGKRNRLLNYTDKGLKL